MSDFSRIAILFLVLSLCSSCGESLTAASENESQKQSTQYDENSWQTMIQDSCLSYFDGCNNCRRNEAGGIAACTRKACDIYEEPKCLDDVENK